MNQASLRARVAQEVEQLQVLVRAAEQRYWEGVELLLAGRFAGGAYLLGYVAEMLLKVAYGRLDGYRPSAQVSSVCARAERFRRRFIRNVRFENYHSIDCWASLIRVQRRRVGSGQTLLDQRLAQRMRRLHGHWVVSMRYQRLIIAPHEAENVYNDVSWLRDHYHLLWR